MFYMVMEYISHMTLHRVTDIFYKVHFPNFFYCMRQRNVHIYRLLYSVQHTHLNLSVDAWVFILYQ